MHTFTTLQLQTEKCQLHDILYVETVTRTENGEEGTLHLQNTEGF